MPNDNDNTNNSNQPGSEEGFTINPIKDLIWALTQLDLLIKDVEGDDLLYPIYKELIERTVTAYYSFLDTQATLDTLANTKATAMLTLFDSLPKDGSGEVTFVSDFAPETDASGVIKGPWAKSTSNKDDNDSDDDDDDPDTKH